MKPLIQMALSKLLPLSESLEDEFALCQAKEILDLTGGSLFEGNGRIYLMSEGRVLGVTLKTPWPRSDIDRMHEWIYFLYHRNGQVLSPVHKVPVPLA